MRGTVRGAVLLVTLAPALLLGQPARAASPALYAVAAVSAAMAVSSTQEPSGSVVTGGLADETAGLAEVALGSGGGATARAATLYPGDLVAGGPALLCAQFLPCPAAPPEYPLLAAASYPDRPSAAVPAGGTARAGARDASADASLSPGVVPGLPVVAVGGGSSRVRGWVDAAGAHARATTSLTDVVVGPLRVAALTVVDDLDVDPAGRVTGRPTVVLTGVTLAGQGARVDERGVHVPGRDDAVPAAALASQGLSVRLLSADRVVGEGGARSSSGGLLVAVSAPVSGVPPVPGLPSLDRTYLGSVVLGQAGASVAAVDGRALTTPSLPAASPAAGVAPALRAVTPASPGAASAVAAPPGPAAVPDGGTPEGRRAGQPGVLAAGRPLGAPLDLAPVLLAAALGVPLLLAAWRASVRPRPRRRP